LAWEDEGDEGKDRRAILVNSATSRILDFGFGFLLVLSEMGKIQEFRWFSIVQNLNFQTKF
jgi:hypothetical protein